MAKKRQPEKPRHMTRRAMSSHKKAERRQRFIFFGGVGIIAAILIIVIIGVIAGEVVPKNKTVVNIGDQKIKYGYYVDALKLYSRMYVSDESKYTVTEVNNALPQFLQQNEIILRNAEELDISVGDDDVKERLELYGMDVNDASMDYMRAQLLTSKLLEDYFGTQVPESMLQVHMQAIFLESMEKADEVRPLMAAADNISDISDEYDLNNVSQKEYAGDFGWHPEDVYRNGEFYIPDIPTDYAFQEGREAGDLSQPISDNETSKELGYWLLRINERSEKLASDNVTPVISANVSGLLLGNLVEAEEIRQQLIDGASLYDLAKEHSQYAASINNGGEMGVYEQVQTEGMDPELSEPADAYIFSENTTIGTWSEPIADTDFSTAGGAWLVRVVDKDENRTLEEADRQYIINKKYNTWFTEKQEAPEFEVVNIITSKQQTEAIAEVNDYLASLG